MASVFDNISFSGNAYHEDLFADLGDGMAMNTFAINSNDSSFEEMHPNTISPKDLWADEFVTSAPPSTAFPPLNTPGSEFLDSPALTGGLDTTPMDDAFLELNASEVEQWPSLFPEETTGQFAKSTMSPAIVQNNSFESLNSMRPPVAPATPSMTRQKSSPGRPPMTAPHLRKHSLSSGINKSTPKVTRKSLPEITIDSEDDKETAKRKKNTAAARKSRERKMMIVESQAVEIDRLRSMVIALGGNPDP